MRPARSAGSASTASGYAADIPFALNLASERVPARLGYAHVDTQASRFERAAGDSGTTKVWRITR